MDSLVQTIHVFIEDKWAGGMEFGIEKCAMLGNGERKCELSWYRVARL